MLAGIGETLAEMGKTIVLDFSGWSNRIFLSLKITNPWLVVLDIIIVGFLIYWFLAKLLETRAIRILYGLGILVILILVGHFLNLVTLNWLLKYLTLVFLIAIPIIFQPELRSALEKLGRAGFGGLKAGAKTKEKVVKEIVEATKFLAQEKRGALILIERKTPLGEYIKSGTYLAAKLSKELLESIFAPNSPLHDGAVVISADQVLAAGCILPQPNNLNHSEKYAAGLGARHRSAVGVTKETDALAVIISEERGTISLAVGGKLEKDLEPETLAQTLSSSLGVKKEAEE